MNVRIKYTALAMCSLFILSCGSEFKNDPRIAAIPCETPELFINEVWPAMIENCVGCHYPGEIGSMLIFNSFDTVDENYNVLRNYVRSGNASKLLGKTIGDLFHGGGTPFIDANSQNYQNLSALVDIMLQDCKQE